MEFIGQTTLIKALKTTNSRSVLLYGPAHFGKKTLARWFYTDRGDTVYEVTGNAQDFRDSIDMIRLQVNPVTYIIPDVDRLHLTVQNMLLKILEEPPMKATFCLTASNYVLPTIKSRCVTYLLDPYTTDEIKHYLGNKLIYLNYADSPGRCDVLQQAMDEKAMTSPASLKGLMEYAKTAIHGNLAVLLVKANEIGKHMREYNIPYFTFYLLAKTIYADYNSVTILTKNLNALDRYIMMDFYMSLWREEQCK